MEHRGAEEGLTGGPVLSFHLLKKHLDEMIEHSRSEAPNECCGVLAGIGDRVTRVFRAANAEFSPTKYSVAPAELLSIMRAIDLSGGEMVGFYHSHTRSRAYPSETDKKLAFWPDCRYVIVSLENEDFPVVRAFRVVDGAVSEEAVDTE